MDKINLLLLSDKSANGSGSQLQLILETGEAAGFEVSVEVLPDDTVEQAPFLPWLLKRRRPNLMLLDFQDDATRKAEAALSILHKAQWKLPVLAILKAGEPEELNRLLNVGASDFVLAPLRADDLLARLVRWRRDAAGSNEVVRPLKEKLGLKQLIGKGALFVREIEKLPKIARCDVSVLITGETGTGKELFARAVHHLSPRSDHPFVPINCGALPAELVENEIFGHERGAFTGATCAAPGLIHESNGGTMFFDEIDSLPLPSQVKLLRLVQEKEYRPLGSCKTHKADVRIIAASNADFVEATRCGRFRQDLFYRLNMITLALPPLRERKEDIPSLASHFLASYSAELAKPARSFSTEAAQKLLAYDWPGNVRENVIGRAVILSEHPGISAEEIQLPTTAGASGSGSSFKALKALAVKEFEQAYLRRILLTHDGNITHAARAAQKNRRAFWHLIRKHHIEIRCFRPHSNQDFCVRQPG